MCRLEGDEAVEKCERAVGLSTPGYWHYPAGGWDQVAEQTEGPDTPVAIAVIRWDERDVGRWTLRAVVERESLMVECGNCWRLVQVDVRTLIGRFGPETEVREVQARMVCRRCGSQRARSLVRLRSAEGAQAWLPVPPRASR